MSNDRPTGYKQTAIGLIPEDWEISLLVNLAEIRSGIAKNSNTSVKNPIFVYYLRVANVQNGFLDLSEMSQLQVSHEDVKRYAVLPGDMLMNEGGDLDKLGRGTLWSGQYIPCIHQNHVFVVRCGSKLLPAYLNCWTGTRAARYYFMTAGKQTTNLASINKTSLGQLPVAHPSNISEQKSIAQSLSDIDALIAALDQTIAKKRAIKTATMQQLLTGKKRLPGFGEGKGYKESAIGVIPEDWEVDHLLNLTQSARPISYGIVQTGRQLPNGIKCIRVVDIVDGKIATNNLITTSQKISDAYKRTILNSGDLVIALRGKIGELAVIQNELEGANLTRGVALIALKENYLSNFYHQYLSSSDSKARLHNSLNGSALQEISIATLRNFSVAIPTVCEQHAIATVLSDMDTEIAAIEARRAKTQAIKQGMMQELLTGRTRLV